MVMSVGPHGGISGFMGGGGGQFSPCHVRTQREGSDL